MRIFRRWCTLALGWGVVGLGMVLIPLPGPGLVVILCGVGVLSLESARARWLLLRCKTYIRSRWPGTHTYMESFSGGIKRWGRVIFGKNKTGRQ